MAVKITGKYLSGLRVELKHGPSGTIIQTDAPTDNNGKGEKFSPTDLAASSLGACILTIMGIVAERNQIDLSTVTFTVEKHMSSDSPRRISKIIIDFQMPKNLDEKQRTKLENAAHTCPVHYSLHPEIEKEIYFNYK